VLRSEEEKSVPAPVPAPKKTKNGARKSK
jgi:hypothetical protein